MADAFSGSAPDRALWNLVYGGSSPGPLSAWEPGQVTVADGAMRLVVSRPRSTQPVTDAGGIAAQGFVRRYGRWETRWRMPSARGVIGQFVLARDVKAPGASRLLYTVSLSSAARALTVRDEAAGRQTVVPLDGTVWHDLAVEWTPQAVTWLVDGRQVATMTSNLPDAGAWPVFQAFMTGPDCGATPLPTDCGGARVTFPVALEVDSFTYRPLPP